MLIDTNGFEICDEVWWVELDWLGTSRNSYKMCNSTIHRIMIDKFGVFGIMFDKYNSRILLQSCFHTEQEAIDYCNHMNGELC